MEQQFSSSGQQLSVLASLLFNNQLEQNAVPSRAPVRNSYITSNFGRRVDPFNGAVAEHKGVDFHASVGSSGHGSGRWRGQLCWLPQWLW